MTRPVAQPVTGRVTVVGVGRAGSACARYLARRAAEGDPVEVTVVDEGSGEAQVASAERLRCLGIRVSLGATDVPPCDLVVTSPGVPPSSPVLRSAAEAGIPVISDIELAFRVCTAPWVAVTGTNGKTTVTSMITHLLREAGIPAEPVGNIGPPAVETAEECGDATVMVAEVSSFQLARTDTFHPRVSVLLNITPDHLAWHGSMEGYAADKARIFANQTHGDTAVIDVDDPGSAPYADTVEAVGATVHRVSVGTAHPLGATLRDGWLTLAGRLGDEVLVRADELAVRGSHNIGNALAAASAVRALGVAPEVITEGLRSFQPVEHRLEPAGSVRGVDFVNDSKATNPDAALVGVRAFEEAPLVVLLGGRPDPSADFALLASEVARHARAAIVFGEARETLAAALRSAGLEPFVRRDMREAVLSSLEAAEAGDTVLLSPACKSFDEFDDYEQRGRVFKALVAELADGASR